MAKAELELIKITPFVEGRLRVLLRGTAPIVVHAFGEDAKAGMRKQGEDEKPTEDGGKAPPKPRARRKPRDQVRQFDQAQYKRSDGSPVFPDCGPAVPAIGFKRAMAEATKYLKGISKDQVNALVHVFGVEDPDFVRLKNVVPHSREDMVRVGKFPNFTTDLRTRAEYPETWEAEVVVRYNTQLLDRDGVLTLLGWAGRLGVYEMRPSKTGMRYGTFEIAEGGVKEKGSARTPKEKAA